MRGTRQILSVWFSLWFLLLNVAAVPMCHAPSGLSFDGQTVVLCHAADHRTHPAEDNDPTGNAGHCPLCLICHLLSSGLPALAPVADLAIPFRIIDQMAPGYDAPPAVRLAIGPQQPRAPPTSL